MADDSDSCVRAEQIDFKRQLKFDKPRYIFTKNTNKTRKHKYCTTKKTMNYINVLMEKYNHNMKQWIGLLMTSLSTDLIHMVLYKITSVLFT